MKVSLTASAILLSVALGVSGAEAACVTKGAVATSADAKSAKWFALETMVQAVGWDLWPGFVATNKVAGYRITGERYSCKPDAGSVTCQGRATFCKTGG